MCPDNNSTGLRFLHDRETPPPQSAGRGLRAVPGECWRVYWREGAISWLQCRGPDPGRWNGGSCGDWDDLPAPAGSRLQLCVPGEYVRIHRVEMPARNRRRFIGSLPYVLEDRLLHPCQEYHYTPLPGTGATGHTPVAVLERRNLDLWLETAARHDWRLAGVYPEYMLIPAPTRGCWHIDARCEPLLLRTEDGGAVIPGALDVSVPGGLTLAIESASPAPHKILVNVSGKDGNEIVRHWEPRLAEAGIELDCIPVSEPRTTWLLHQDWPEKKLNLLSGTYAVQDESSQWVRRALPAAILATVLVTLVTGQWLMEGMRLQREDQRLRQSMEDVYRQVFPDAKHLVDPRYQMEQRLEGLLKSRRTSARSSDLLVLLERLAPALVETAGSELQSLNFDGSDLVLEISVPDFEALSLLQNRLAGTVTVKVEEAGLRNGRVYGRLRVQGAG